MISESMRFLAQPRETRPTLTDMGTERPPWPRKATFRGV